jgi:hypothetical protein
MRCDVRPTNHPPLSLKRSILQFLALVLLVSAAHGQQAKVERTCRILFLGRPAGAPSTLHLFDGTASREVDLPGMNLSRIYELPPGPIRLALLSAPLDDPEKLPPGAPSATVPKSATDIFLLVTDDPANQVAPVRMNVVDAGAAKLRRGQTLWFNLTELTVGGKLGSEMIVLKPESRAVMDSPRNDAGDYHVRLSYRMEGKEHLYPICETRWMHDPRRRNLGFVIAGQGSRVPRVLVFPDYRE